MNSTSYQIGTYLDALDTENIWRVAQVIDLFENKLKIHYEGWGSKYDISIDKDSNKLARFREHTRGYTGQRYNAMRAEWHFDS